MSKMKIFIYSLLIVSFISVGNFGVSAQSKETGILFQEPMRLILKGETPVGDEQNYNALLRETFYPIGWSKDGKFAYLVEPPDEACGCYFATIIVQDLKTDKILWKDRYVGDSDETETLAAYWKKNQARFSIKLAEYGIEAQNSFAVQSDSFAYQSDTLTTKLIDKTTLDKDYKVSGGISLQFISKTKGRKTIYEKIYDAKNYELFLKADIAGSLISPFEPRAAVIMVEVYRGWEGPPNVTDIRIIGATLTNGFR